MPVLNDSDQKIISATIAEVESKTAGEIVVAVVSQSDDYDQILLGVNYYPRRFDLTCSCVTSESDRSHQMYRWQISNSASCQ